MYFWCLIPSLASERYEWAYVHSKGNRIRTYKRDGPHNIILKYLTYHAVCEAMVQTSGAVHCDVSRNRFMVPALNTLDINYGGCCAVADQ